MLRFAQGLTDHTWINNYDRNLVEQLRPLMLLEEEAVEIVTLQHSVLPVLVQTEDYMRALLHASCASVSEEEAQVTARLRRQQFLDRPGAADLTLANSARKAVSAQGAAVGRGRLTGLAGRASEAGAKSWRSTSGRSATSITSPVASASERSTRFSSSRTLPGQR